MKKTICILTLLLLVGFQGNAQTDPYQNLDRSQVYQVIGNNYQPMTNGWNTPWNQFPNQQFMRWDQGSNGWRIFVVSLNVLTQIVNLVDVITGTPMNIPGGVPGINQSRGWIGGGVDQ